MAPAGTSRPWTGQPAWPSSTLFSLPDDKSELEGSTLSVLSATSTASHLLPPQERLREKAFEYCQRLMEQSTRRESCCHASSPRGRLALLVGAWSLDSLFVGGGGGFVFPGLNPRLLGRGQNLSPAHQVSAWVGGAARPSAPSLLSALSSSFQNRVPFSHCFDADRRSGALLPSPGALRKGDADLQKAVSARRGGRAPCTAPRELGLRVSAVPGGGRAGAGRALPAGPLLPVPHAVLPEGPARAAVWGRGPGARAASHRAVLPEPR